MELRKLEQQEHGKTRRLWEQVFAEDTKAFLDFYYFIKARQNEIYVIEEKEKICSMLHLNPYAMQVENHQFVGNYIVAVATEPKYRKRGYMGALLRRAMQDMYDRGEWFTFLMPAAEAIYSPYDFRFVYDQKQSEVTGAEEKRAEQVDIVAEKVEVREATMGDCGIIAQFFASGFSEKYQIYAARDESYYQSLLLERQSENGGIRLLWEDERLVGVFSYMDEEQLEIFEPLVLEKYETVFLEKVNQMNPYLNLPVKLYGYGKVQKPMIMIRILRLEKLLSAMKVKNGEHLECSFAVLDTVVPQNNKIWHISGERTEADDRAEPAIHVRETEDSEGVITIGALTSLLFGYKTVAEVAEEEHVILSTHLAKELEKIQTLDKIFLNEIV